MNLIQSYINYLKDNPKGYWFKRKWFGWGWVPATRQGWLVLLVYLGFLLWTSLKLKNQPVPQQLNLFSFPILFATALLLFICYKKGEPPKWHWGRK